MLNFDPKPPMNPLSDRQEIWRAWLRHGYLPPRKIGVNPLRGFFSPHRGNIHPHVRYTTLRSRMFTTFFGSSNCLQPRRLHVAFYLSVQLMWFFYLIRIYNTIEERTDGWWDFNEHFVQTKPPGCSGHCPHPAYTVFTQRPDHQPQAAPVNPSLMDYYSFNQSWRAGWLSWPCWLTDSRRFTHKVLTRPAISSSAG